MNKINIINEYITKKSNVDIKEYKSKTSKNISKKNEKSTNHKKCGIYESDIYLFHQGTNYKAYGFMGAHTKTEKKQKGVKFTVWVPNAKNVIVVGDFCNWEILKQNSLKKLNNQGIWSGFVSGLSEGCIYKYAIEGQDGQIILKADPYATRSEVRPNTASIVYKPKHKWNDKKWRDKIKTFNPYMSPINVYELHLGSWKKKQNGDFYTYLELAELLPSYLKNMGYTHVEILPIMEHPLDGSWGYQITGFYSPTSRYGTGEELKFLIDRLHKEEIGVILDWVPGHFCKDEHGLSKFGGSHAYEYEEPLKAENMGWGTANFDLGRGEVKSFLISNALYWFRDFHIDGMRVDAVANMLYLDFGKDFGQWMVNEHGGNENIQAVQFLKELNNAIFKEFPNVLMIAEESTAWPMVTRPVEDGGLGFNFKWNMGWMNDMLEYIKIDPVFRKDHHNKVTFSMMYHYSENYILAISHDEVVHGKKSLLDKNWGDYWNKFAGLRNFAAYMMGHPGKKTIFMGCEFGQFIEWKDKEELDWQLIDKYDMHKKTFKYFKDINNLYKENKALWEYDYGPNGFQWIDADNRDQSVFSFIRKTNNKEELLIFVCNFTPVVYYNFKIGVPYLGEYKEVLNSDDECYGGSGQVMRDVLVSQKDKWHNYDYSLTIKVPPMGTSIIKVKAIINNEK